MAKYRNVFIIVGILLILNVFSWLAAYHLSRSHFLEVIFFDVGQGDSVFIETPQKHQILIDGGPNSTILEKLSKEMPFWDRTIDLIILTHPEKDHLTGLLEVLKRYKVENILWTGAIKDTAEFKEWQRLIEEEKNQDGAKIEISRPGQKITASSVVFDILYPFDDFRGQELKNTNDSSIVVKLTFGENDFLFTGDIHKSAEKQILEKGVEIDSDILKVSHHGSKTSSGEEFVFEVSPELAVISAGKKNTYGHPHRETLDILKKYDINILRTDLQGDIKIISNGKKYISVVQN